MNPLIVRAYLTCRSIYNTLTSGARPPKNIPIELLDQFTLDGQVEVLRWYINDAKPKPLVWTTRSHYWDVDKVKSRGQQYYGQVDSDLYDALDEHSIRDKDVAIVGSESPWYECICSHYGANVTTIEYRQIDCQIPNIRVLTTQQHTEDPQKYDVVVSISSIEHDGLGRYGDPINPQGDLRAMGEFRDMLKLDGMLILVVPIGKDVLVWNAHRIYGRKRFALLTEGWQFVDSYGFSDEMFNATKANWQDQPVLILKPKNEKVDT